MSKHTLLKQFCETHIRYVKLFNHLLKRIDVFNSENVLIEEMAKLTLNKKFRRRNFPEDVSETMVRFIIWRNTGIMPVQNSKGDLLYLGKNVEVKAFISDGPSSFGPSESWDEIYFLDLTQVHTGNRSKIILYKINLPMESKEWQAIKVNQKESMGDQQRSGRRPRIQFSKVQDQLDSKFICVEYDGYFEDLL